MLLLRLVFAIIYLVYYLSKKYVQMKLESYVGEQLGHFYGNLKKTVNNADLVATHDLRVALKKLLALNKVVDIYIPSVSSPYKNSIKKIYSIFKQAGAVRDGHIMSELAFEWLSTREYIEFKRWICIKINSSRRKLNRLYLDFNIDVVRSELCGAFKHISGNYMPEFRDYLLIYIEENGKKISRYIQSKKCDFHAVRRWVKEQYYIQDQLNVIMGMSISKDILSKKRQQGKILGEWHDLQVFEKYLKKSGCDVKKLIRSRIIKKQKLLIKNAVTLL